MRKLPLSKQEQKVWKYILGYFSDNGYSPTRKEIGVELGYKLNGAPIAQTYLKNMAAKGYIKFKPEFKSRNIIILVDNYKS